MGATVWSQQVTTISSGCRISGETRGRSPNIIERWGTVLYDRRLLVRPRQRGNLSEVADIEEPVNPWDSMVYGCPHCVPDPIEVEDDSAYHRPFAIVSSRFGKIVYSLTGVKGTNRACPKRT
jgi:hypothetical protein